MPREEIDTLMAELQAWADQAEFGAQKKLAESLGVPHRGLVTGLEGENFRTSRMG